MTASIEPVLEPRRGPVASLGWALFLASSWTWCIGMYLPVLLIRDYGLLSWFVFAVPNVLGAAAMGFVLRRPDASARLVEKHRPALLAFSVVTLAFHGFFLGWLFSQQRGGPLAALGVYLGMTGIGWFLLTRGRAMDRILAAVVWLASFVALLWFSHYRFSRHISLPAWTVLDSIELAFLAPVCWFGFALCPYLDLTFHRARQACVPSTARFAFGLGFGMFFLLMIVFTAVYSDLLGTSYLGPAALSVLLWHILAQASLTSALHLRELQNRSTRTTLLVAGIVPACFVVASQLDFSHAGLGGGEIGYRVFMAFYGLVFPAYAWVCFGREPSPGTLALFLVAVLIATPFFWLGFIERREGWLVVGLLVVLLSRWVSARADRTRPTPAITAP